MNPSIPSSAVRTAPFVADSVTAAGDTSTPAANLFRIAADLPGGKPAPIDGVLPRRSAHPSCSFQRRPTHNTCGQRSERNPFSVQFGAGYVVGLLDHPSVRSPVVPVVVTFGTRNSEHEPKEFPDDGNLTAQRIKLTARGGNAKG